MTVSGAIIAWLKTFEVEEYWKMRHIDTDFMHGNVDYVLMKEPTQNVTTLVTGDKVFEDYYMLQARLPNNTNADNTDNNEFGEELENWVRKKNKNREYPVIPGAVVTAVGITTPFYVGKVDKGNSIYQMTISVKYEK